MDRLVDAPAGQFGRVTRQGNQLIYNGRPLKLWGLNLSFGAQRPKNRWPTNAPTFIVATASTRCVWHKWADGSGWAGILGARYGC
jgi:hypothetical protein